MSTDPVLAAVDVLVSRKASLRCEEVVALLEGLGFIVRDGKKQGHKVVTHPGLDDFLSTSFSCGHGRNPTIKAAYAVSLRRVLTMHADALRDFLRR